jgi:hypothetical protein
MIIVKENNLDLKKFLKKKKIEYSEMQEKKKKDKKSIIKNLNNVSIENDEKISNEIKPEIVKKEKVKKELTEEQRNKMVEKMKKLREIKAEKKKKPEQENLNN